MFSSLRNLIRSGRRALRSRAKIIQKQFRIESLESRELFAGTPVEYLGTFDNPDTRQRTDLRVGAAVAVNAQYTIVSVPSAVNVDPSINSEIEPNYDRYTGRLLVYNTSTGNLIRTIYSPLARRSYFGEQIDLYDKYLVVTRSDFSAKGHVYVFDVSTGESITPSAISSSGFNEGYLADLTSKTYPGSSLTYRESPVAINGNYIAFVRAINTTDFFGNRIVVNKLTVVDYINAPYTYIDLPDTLDGEIKKIALYNDYVATTTEHNAHVFQISAKSHIRSWTNVDATDVDFHYFEVVVSRPTANSGAGSIVAYNIATGAQIWQLAPQVGYPAGTFGSTTDINGDLLVTGSTVVAGYDLTNQQFLRSYTIPGGSRVSDISVSGNQFVVGLGVPDNQVFPALRFDVGASASNRSYTYNELASFGLFGYQVVVSDQYITVQAPGDRPEISKIFVYDRATNALIQTIQTNSVKRARMILDGNIVLLTSGYHDQTEENQHLYAYDVISGSLLYSIPFKHSYIGYDEDDRAFTLSPTKLAVLDLGDFDGRIKIYDKTTGALLRASNPNIPGFSAVSATYQGEILYVAGDFQGSNGIGTSGIGAVDYLLSYNFATDTWARIFPTEGNGLEPIIASHRYSALNVGSGFKFTFYNLANQSIVSQFGAHESDFRFVNGQAIWNNYFFIESQSYYQSGSPVIDMYDIVTGEFIQQIVGVDNSFGTDITVDAKSIFVGAPVTSGGVNARGAVLEYRMPTIGLVNENDVDNSISVGQSFDYTVSFTRGIQSGTLTTADFRNFGSATVTIDNVVETSPGSGIYTVSITPTTGGTVQLQLRDNTNLVDEDGRALMLSATSIQVLNAVYNGADVQFLLSGQNLTINAVTNPLTISVIGTVDGLLEISGFDAGGQPGVVRYRVVDLTINGTALVDTIRLNKAEITNVTINLGAGNDRLYLGADNRPSITSPAGRAAGTAAGTLSILGTITVNGNEGNDQITMYRVFVRTGNEGALSTFNLGSGNDTLDAYWNNFASSVAYDLGTGDDILSLGFQVDRFNTEINCQDGDDLVSIYISSFQHYNGVSVNGGNGYDTLAVDTNNIGGPLQLIGGADDDTLVVAASIIGALQIEGNDGNDFIKIGRHYANDSTGGCIVDHGAYVNGNDGDDEVIMGNNSFSQLQLNLGLGDDSIDIIEYLLVRSSYESYLDGGEGTNRLRKVSDVDAAILNFTVESF